jgi:hypothetical protein
LRLQEAKNRRFGSMSERRPETSEGQKRQTKQRAISFRVSAEAYELIENIASREGETVNGWARKFVLGEAENGSCLTGKERALYEEIARLGYLLNHGFGLLSIGKLTDEEWMRRLKDSKSTAGQLAKAMLEQRPAREWTR